MRRRFRAKGAGNGRCYDRADPSHGPDWSDPTDDTEETRRTPPNGGSPNQAEAAAAGGTAGAGPGPADEPGTTGGSGTSAAAPGTRSGTTASRDAGSQSAGSGSAPPVGEEPRSLRASVGSFRDAGMRLVRAHIDLAKAELGQILGEIQRLTMLAGVAIGALVLLGFFFPIGLALFLGEWIFGSIGWGLLHGTLLLVGIAVSAGLTALGTTRGQLGRSFLVALFLGIVVGGLFAFDQPNVAWTRIGEATGLAVDPTIRPLVVGTLVVALVGAVLGLMLGAVAGGGWAATGLVTGVVLGAILGAFSAITFGVRVGAAVGLSVTLLAWPILSISSLARRGVDTNALRARFWPSVTIETAKETVEWISGQTPAGRKP